MRRKPSLMFVAFVTALLTIILTSLGSADVITKLVDEKKVEMLDRISRIDKEIAEYQSSIESLQAEKLKIQEELSEFNKVSKITVESSK